MSKQTTNKPFKKLEDLPDVENLFTLVLLNDEVNLYEHVVKTLVEVCEHNWEQAEQCTLIAHHKGKCDVKKGLRNDLRPLREELARRGLSSIILEN